MRANQRPSSAMKKSGSSKHPGCKNHEKFNEANDRCHDLEKENLVLKEKENLLEREILKMQTKLKRIEELMRSGRAHQDLDFAKLQTELEVQFGDIRDENETLKERVRKLTIIYKGLSNKGYAAKSKIYPPTGGSFKKAARPATGSKTTTATPYIPGQPRPQHVQLVEELKLQLVKNEKEIINLKAEKERLVGKTSGHLTTDDLIRKIREREAEIRDIVNQYDDIQSSFVNKEKIFKDSKSYMEEVLKQIGEAKINNQTLGQKNIRLQIMASQAKSLNDQLRDMEIERNQLESAIRRITSEPFFNREKGQSTLKRIAELEEKYIEKDKLFKSVKEEEATKQTALQQLIPEVERLRGERNHLEAENKKLKEKFSTSNNLEEFNVYKTLFQMDPTKYAQTMSDLSKQNIESYPIWANIDFLERQKEQEQLDPNNVKQLKFEIMKIRHENKDFAAELEKAQNLLQLQRDIEKDNTSYYEAEKQRLLLMSKSSMMKAEELARRADEKQRQINEMTRKLGLTSGPASRSPSPQKRDGLSIGPHQSAGGLDNFETMSEFSAMTNESEVRTDENVLDFVIQDAEYYFDTFKQVMDEKELMLHQKTLITFVTVDFYNHDTETSQIAEGFRPLYNTQFSFKNKIDDFYVQFLQKNTLKIDVYISKNNTAIHLGHAEVFLREVVEREVGQMDAKPPVIQKVVRLFAKNLGIGPANEDQPIGNLRFKMRMRRPISEAIRYYREKNDIANMRAQETFIEGGSRKKLITVQIVGCKDIKVKYSGVSPIAPFFYYQFYSFDERYSATGAGENAIFEDTQNYEVIFDAKLISYLQREPLEVILFDDNAPITGIERGGQAQGEQSDDMIGSVKIPLQELIKGASIHDRFPIRNNQREHVGHLEAKISIIDIDTGSIGTMDLRSRQQLTLHYNKQWENEFIYKIAKKLAKFPGEVELLFSIFSRGQKTVTKEDFKYTLLMRIQMKTEISEREIDMFLRGCPQILDKEVIDLHDFLMIFSASISQARHDIQDEEAIQIQTIKRFEDMQRSQTGFNRSMTQNSFKAFDDFARSQTGTNQAAMVLNQSSSRSNMLTYTEQEVMEILSKTKAGNISAMLEQMHTLAQVGMINQSDFMMILTREGSISDFEATKVANFFQIKGSINIERFESYLKQSIHYQIIQSEALVKFINLVKGAQGEMLAQSFISKDFNRDGELDCNGFLATVLMPEFGMKPEESKEAFQLIQRNNMFRYRDFFIEHNSSLRHLFMSRTVTPSIPTSSRQEMNAPVLRQESALDESRVSLSSQMFEDPRIRIIKNKLKNYLMTQDITLSSLFKIIDTNSDQVLTLAEFKQKMKAMHTQLDDGELSTLFQLLDKTGKGTINYQQFVSEFPEINISFMIRKIKNIIIGTKVAIEVIFNEYCTDKATKRMDSNDFKKFVKKYIDKAADHEIDSLFRHFTQDSKTYLILEDFIEAFGRDVREQTFKIGIEDIIKPLATKIQAFKVNIAQLFDKYDVNKNSRLTAEELARALRNDMNLQLQDDEIQVIKDYFKSKFNTLEIKKLDFIGLLNTKFQRKFDSEEARKSLTILKQKLATLGRTSMQAMAPYDLEKTRRLSLRNFKIAINNLKSLSQYQIDNLTKYLDKEDDGFISIDEFDVAIRGVHVPLSASGSFSVSQSGKRNEKWK